MLFFLFVWFRLQGMSLKRLLYTLFLYVIFPLVLLRLLWRSRANPGYRKRLSERLGFVSLKIDSGKPIIWVHAVSVGEVIATKPLIQALFKKFPHHSILLTTTTPTGSDRVQQLFADEIKKLALIHVYFPYDLIGSVSRFIKAYEPKILIVVETEIWPNLYAKCHQQKIPVVMVNARLSQKSVTSYLKIKGLVAETLSKVNLIAVRSKVDAKHFSSLGAKDDQLEEIGNIKYDINIDENQVFHADKYLKILNINSKNKRPVLVAASTHKGEDTTLLFIYQKLLKRIPELILILVPRHPERFDDVYSDCLEQLPKNINTFRHSQFGHSSTRETEKINVILGDSMGEMQMWYALADIVFIGGSLVNTGGHNPLEATVFGVPVFSGSHMFNFEDIASELSEAELLFSYDDELELMKGISDYLLLNNGLDKTESSKKIFIQKTDDFMQQHQGVTARLIDRIVENLTD